MRTPFGIGLTVGALILLTLVAVVHLAFNGRRTGRWGWLLTILLLPVLGPLLYLAFGRRAADDDWADALAQSAHATPGAWAEPAPAYAEPAYEAPAYAETAYDAPVHDPYDAPTHDPAFPDAVPYTPADEVPYAAPYASDPYDAPAYTRSMPGDDRPLYEQVTPEAPFPPEAPDASLAPGVYEDMAEAPRYVGSPDTYAAHSADPHATRPLAGPESTAPAEAAPPAAGWPPAVEADARFAEGLPDANVAAGLPPSDVPSEVSSEAVEATPTDGEASDAPPAEAAPGHVGAPPAVASPLAMPSPGATSGHVFTGKLAPAPLPPRVPGAEGPGREVPEHLRARRRRRG